jgi:hypothetical protein
MIRGEKLALWKFKKYRIITITLTADLMIPNNFVQ